MICLDYGKLEKEPIATAYCQQVLEKAGNSYPELTSAIQKASLDLLPKREKARPGWFKDKEDILLPLIESRNSAMSAVYNRRTRCSVAKLRKARRNLKLALQAVKTAWIETQCSSLNSAAFNNRGTAEAWSAVDKLRKGLSKTVPANVKPMKKEDGTSCSTPEENAQVFRSHFEKLYSRPANYDPTVIDELPQHAVAQQCDQLPTDDEIRKAVQKLRNSGPGDTGICAQAWKCLLKSEETYPLIKQFVISFWRDEIVPTDWETGVLKILPKKGDLSDPGNHRGIMLLEVAYKIVAIIILTRIQPIEEGLDHES